MVGLRLADLTWPEAAKALTSDALVVLPLGAQAKEHGPHLRLDNDFRLAEALAARLLARAEVVVAPTLNYHYYPAFTDYPGSTTLRAATARDLTLDVVRSLGRHGPRRFYALNTGVSTAEVLAEVAPLLAAERVLFRFTDWSAALRPAEERWAEQEGGSHADEVETSLLLALAPERVDMTKAVKEYEAGGRGPLVRDPRKEGKPSPSGVWGDPTLATKEKGAHFLDAVLARLLRDLAELRAAPLP